MRLAEKVVVVTGGASGIGRQLVLQLLRRGARVAAVDIREDDLDATAGLAGAGERLSRHVVDITDRDQVERLPEAVVRHHGTVDGLVNNAGIIQPFVPLKDLGYDVIHRVLDVNLMGTIHMLKAFLPRLVDRPEAHVANVSSMGAFLPVPGQTLYGASKAAVKLMTEGLYAELMETQVGVSVVMPGAIETEITKHSGVATPDAGGREFKGTSAEEAARIILDGIESNAFHILVGRDAKLMFLASRVAPKRATRLIQKQMKGLLNR